MQTLGIQAYWDQVSHRMDDHLRASAIGKPRPYSMQCEAYIRTAGAKVDGGFAIGPGTLTAGADYYNRTWNVVNRMAMMHYMDTAMIPDVRTDNLGFYAGYELPLPRNLVLKGGLREDFAWVRARKPTNKPTGEAEYAMTGGNLQLAWTPEKCVEVSLGFGSAVRPPDAQELFINSSKQQGNPFLNPTRNNEVDLGVKYANEGSFVKLAVFDSMLQDYINMVPTGALRTFENIDANIWGAELGAQSALLESFFLRVGLSYAEGRNLTNDRPLEEMPPLRGSAALRYDVNLWFVELAQNFAAAQYGSFSVYGGVYNLFDKFYYTSLSYQRDPFASGVKVPENGRTLAVTAAYRF